MSTAPDTIREQRRADLRAAYAEAMAVYTDAGIAPELAITWALGCVAAEWDTGEAEVVAALVGNEP